MEVASVAAQVMVALGIYNVWLLRRGQPTGWRGGSAASLREEFDSYGLPRWSFAVIGALKLTFATMLLAGIWLPSLVVPAALGLAVLMLGAVVMHARVGDPVRRSLPAASMLALCLFAAVA